MGFEMGFCEWRWMIGEGWMEIKKIEKMKRFWDMMVGFDGVWVVGSGFWVGGLISGFLIGVWSQGFGS